MSCSSNQKIDIQGHRGCAGLYPENSLPAFEKAVKIGVNTLELDIAISKDRKVVVTHEPYMNPEICLDPDGNEILESEKLKFNLFQMNYEDIKKFDCGTKFHSDHPGQIKVKTYKPLLSEVFQLVNSLNSDVNFNVEIKSLPEYYGEFTPHPDEYVTIVLEEIIQFGFIDKVNLQSFDLNILEEIKRQLPNMPVALLVGEDENIEAKLKTLSYKPEIISPYYKLLSSENVASYQGQGFAIIPWTVNAKSDIEKMIAMGVNGIITDYPNRLVNMLNR